MNFQRFSTQKRGFLSLAFWQFWPIALLIFTMVCPFVSPFYFTLFFLTPLLMHVSTNLKNLLMNSCIYFSKIVTMKIFTASTGMVYLTSKRLLKLLEVFLLTFCEKQGKFSVLDKVLSLPSAVLFFLFPPMSSLSTYYS